jgi:hypothetical protein
MKSLLTITSFILIFIPNLYSQEDPYTQCYQGEIVEVIAMDTNGNVLGVHPFGIKPTVQRHTFFKSWTIKYIDKEGVYRTNKYEYFKTVNGGELVQMKFDDEQKIYLVDFEDGFLQFIPLIDASTDTKVITVLTISGLKLLPKK